MSRKIITQHELHKLSRLERALDEAKSLVKKLGGEYSRVHDGILGLIDEGTPIQNGTATVDIMVKPGRRSPAWRKEYEERLGKAAAEEVVANTEPGPDSRSLKVTIL